MNTKFIFALVLISVIVSAAACAEPKDFKAPTRDELIGKLKEKETRDIFVRAKESRRLSSWRRQNGYRFPDVLLNPDEHVDQERQQAVSDVRLLIENRRQKLAEQTATASTMETLEALGRVETRLRDFPGTDVYHVDFLQGNDGTCAPNSALRCQSVQGAVNKAFSLSTASIVVVVDDAAIHGPVNFLNVSVDLISTQGPAAVLLAPLYSTMAIQATQSIIVTEMAIIALNGISPLGFGMFNVTLVSNFIQLTGTFAMQNMWVTMSGNAFGFAGFFPTPVAFYSISAAPPAVNPFAENTIVEAVRGVIVLDTNLFLLGELIYANQSDNGNFLSFEEAPTVENALPAIPSLTLYSSYNTGPVGQLRSWGLVMAYDLDNAVIPLVTVNAGHNGRILAINTVSRRQEGSALSDQVYQMSSMTGTSTWNCSGCVLGGTLLPSTDPATVASSYTLEFGLGSEARSGGGYGSSKHISLASGASYTVGVNDDLVIIDSLVPGSGNQIVLGSYWQGKKLTINVMTAPGGLSVTSSVSGALINGMSSQTVTGARVMCLQESGGNWFFTC